MNYNPLLIKSFIAGKMPFIKERTLARYNKYLSDHRFSQVLEDDPTKTETVSAYTLRKSNTGIRGYQINRPAEISQTAEFLLDEADITYSEYFSEREWMALGLLLRAYKEVENVDLMHLYNCLYSGSSDTVVGKVLTNRKYTLYGSTQLPVSITASYLSSENISTSLSVRVDHSLTILSKANPIHLEVVDDGNVLGRLVDISIQFYLGKYQPATLVEGDYKSIVNFDRLQDPYYNPDESNPIPETLALGEYSRKLVEFAAGTLITPLSDENLLLTSEKALTKGGSTFSEKVKKATPGIFNKDGYLDRRVKI
jgi:hypothetical protein